MFLTRVSTHGKAKPTLNPEFYFQANRLETKEFYFQALIQWEIEQEWEWECQAKTEIELFVTKNQKKRRFIPHMRRKKGGGFACPRAQMLLKSIVSNQIIFSIWVLGIQKIASNISEQFSDNNTYELINFLHKFYSYYHTDTNHIYYRQNVLELTFIITSYIV